jgi:hypothetical protein
MSERYNLFSTEIVEEKWMVREYLEEKVWNEAGPETEGQN